MNEWPEGSIQEWVDPWWLEKSPLQFERGRLIWAYLPHIAQQPMVLVSKGRKEPTVHNEIMYEIKPLDINRPPAPPRIPVAALPDYHEETKQVFRTKKRPALVICSGGSEIPKGLRTGGAQKFSLTCLIAPYYGGDQSGTRSGYKKEFLEQARRAAWPQFIWDKLPLTTRTNESILRLDHIQPVPREEKAVKLTPFCLSKDALNLIDEWFDWLLHGSFPEDSLLMDLREDLLKSQ